VTLRTTLAGRINRRSASVTLKGIGARRGFVGPLLFLALALGGLLLCPVLLFPLAFSRLLGLALFFPLPFHRGLLGALALRCLLGPHPCRGFLLGSLALGRLLRAVHFFPLSFGCLLGPELFLALALRCFLLALTRRCLGLPQAIRFGLMPQVIGRFSLSAQTLSVLLRPYLRRLLPLTSQALGFLPRGRLLQGPLTPQLLLLAEAFGRRLLPLLGLALLLSQPLRRIRLDSLRLRLVLGGRLPHPHRRRLCRGLWWSRGLFGRSLPRLSPALLLARPLRAALRPAIHRNGLMV
jgi:hypothetical protein